ncbi:hypothetical protein C6V83_10860 [Gordonia iterans]|uniref:Uncharacterized protein n=1 Tax=Gordonia iterans TaxID=1004901 RepID=A0A2S0KG83_9ACTN|nr:hypothetical protein [Gordonia iterans]AVM00697.1 hypothetical protein C6V83_10860 [Gordonia iterans]
MSNQHLNIAGLINGRRVTRDEILSWEAKRIPKAARKIGPPVPLGDFTRQKEAFCDSKLELAPDEIRQPPGP